MARPGQLARAVAEAFDLEEPSVRQQARVLRDAGLMTMENGGRGEGSMTLRDATNLLIAAAGSSRVKASARPVQLHGACKCSGGNWAFEFSGMKRLVALGEDHTFADALEELLHLAGSRADGEDAIAVSGGSRVSVCVEISEPSPRATIKVGLHGRDADGLPKVTNVSTRIYEPLFVHGTFDPPFRAGSVGDLSHTHAFTEKALLRVAREFR